MRNGAEDRSVEHFLEEVRRLLEKRLATEPLLLFHALDDPAENRPVPQLFARHISFSMRI
jgi:hypothetical protein